MNNGRLISWLQIGANLGILAGLIMVWLQMDQNEKLLRLQITSQFYESYIAADSTVGGENMPAILQKSIDNPGQLSYSEMRAMESQTFSPLTRWISLYRLAEDDLLDDRMWQSQVTLDAPFYFGTAYGRAWWDVSSQIFTSDYLPVELKDHINQALADSNADGFRVYYDRIKARSIERAAELSAARDALR